MTPRVSVTMTGDAAVVTAALLADELRRCGHSLREAEYLATYDPDSKVLAAAAERHRDRYVHIADALMSVNRAVDGVRR